jgi:hypothetical protein
MIFAARVHDSAMMLAANWSKSSSFSGTSHIEPG